MGSYMVAATDVDFMIHGLFQYELFGQKLWITTTHVCTLIVMLILVATGVLGKPLSTAIDAVYAWLVPLAQLACDGVFHLFYM